MIRVPFHSSSRAQLAGAFASLLAAIACGGHPEDQFGTVEVALQGSSRGSDYELVDAVFDIEGVTSATLHTDGQDTLSTTLPVGDYTARLRDGWRLLEVSAGAQEEVTAVLSTPNPAPFVIASGATTEVRFGFSTGEGAVSFGEGVLEVGIAVTKQVAVEVIFSEVMKNPVIVSDADGEWLELYNSGSGTVSLQNCELTRDGAGFTIDAALVVEPGASVTLASSSAPGFTPDYEWSSLTLPNTGSFTLSLACAGTTLDSVVVDPAATPNAAGASLSLGATALTADDNDPPAAWCDAVDSYDGDLGTPGQSNPPCP
jgi:hypothetical protein